MKKKGFTLVELLAVIAILAILAIVALPNVIELFQQAKQKSFINDVKAVYNQAKNQYMVNQLDASSSGNTFYSDADTASANGTTCSGASTLSLDGRANTSGFKYAVVVASDGKITRIEVTDGTYSFKKTEEGGINVIDIKAETNSGFGTDATSSTKVNCSGS